MGRIRIRELARIMGIDRQELVAKLFPALVLAAMVAGWAAHAGATTLPGVPLSPRPGSLPNAWFGLLNDALGGEIGDNPDDFRTQTFYGAMRWRQDWILAADYSILTHKGSALFDEGRVDELTLTLGRRLYQRGDRSWLLAGLGGRFTSDLGGEGVQNGWHEMLGIDRVELPYEDTGQLAAVAYLCGSTLRTRTRPVGRFARLAPFAARSRWGIGVDGGALMSSEGELQAQLTGRLAWLGRDGSLWLGGRHEIRVGPTPDTTTAAVAEREKGSWFVYGGSFGRFFFAGGYNLRNDASVGRAGWLWSGSPPGRREADFAGEVGVSLSALGFGTQVRWNSPLLKRDGVRFLVDYRFGHVPGVEIEDQLLKYQQFVAGLDFELRPGRRLVPFVYGGLGWHFEELKDDGDHPPFPEAGTHAAAVQLGVGLRLYYLRSKRAHYAVVLSGDGWLLSRDAVARSASRELRYLEPKLSLGLRLTIEPAW